MVPTFQTSLSSFRSLDIFIGAASFTPILFFTLFLYLFKRTEFFPAFPTRFTFVSNLFAVLVVPFLFVTNEVGSFIGNDYAVVQFQTVPPSSPQFAVGSHNHAAETARLFFDSIALALMAAFSISTFLVFFIRLSASVVNQRRIEDEGGTQEETYLFKGTGWMALGLVFASAETLAGFASGSFGLFFTRRLLRMLGRACVAIGVVKGPDRRLQFDMLDNEKRDGRRKSTMRLRIGAPLLVDSSRRISQLMGIDLTRGRDSMQPGTGTGTVPLVPNSIPFPMAQETPLSRYPNPPDMSSVKSSQRVTVSLRRGRAPTLILRLSDNNLPSPTAIMSGNLSAHSSTYSYSGEAVERGPPVIDPSAIEDDAPSPRMSVYSAGKSLVENFKTQTFPSGSSGAQGLPSRLRVHPQVSLDPPPLQMPAAIPVAVPRISFLQRTPRPPINEILPPDDSTAIPRRPQSKRKGSPPTRASIYLDRSDFISPISPQDGAVQFPPIPDSATRQRTRSTASSATSPHHEDRVEYTFPYPVASTGWMSPQPQRPVTATSASTVDPARAHSLRRPRSAAQRRPASPARSPDERPGHDSAAALNFDWIINPGIQHESEEAAEQEESRRAGHARSSSQVLRQMPPPRTPRTPDSARQSSRSVGIGTVSRRQTPLPTPAAETRASVNVEQLISPGPDNSSIDTDLRNRIDYRATGSETDSLVSSATISTWTTGHQGHAAVSLNAAQLMERYGEAV
ncbi:hypothetical protein K488DRAFT_83641 [Vararia minispora EC-137]|uniref:Uncharacterized protein n=1 Tax=Vararia minispora EC-137 TaxID=1314806 RepID=A0ACB8QT05_9AGAM|nr:hypothetical protein K488DRAFT_83641 [Vararia minispora EC-137]